MVETLNKHGAQNRNFSRSFSGEDIKLWLINNRIEGLREIGIHWDSRVNGNDLIDTYCACTRTDLETWKSLIEGATSSCPLPLFLRCARLETALKQHGYRTMSVKAGKKRCSRTSNSDEITLKRVKSEVVDGSMFENHEELMKYITQNGYLLKVTVPQGAKQNHVSFFEGDPDGICRALGVEFKGITSDEKDKLVYNIHFPGPACEVLVKEHISKAGGIGLDPATCLRQIISYQRFMGTMVGKQYRLAKKSVSLSARGLLTDKQDLEENISRSELEQSNHIDYFNSDGIEYTHQLLVENPSVKKNDVELSKYTLLSSHSKNITVCTNSSNIQSDNENSSNGRPSSYHYKSSYDSYMLPQNSELVMSHDNITKKSDSGCHNEYNRIESI